MYPSFSSIPVWFLVMLGAGAVAAAFSGKNIKINLLAGAVCAVIGAFLGRHYFPADQYSVPIQNYGLLMLTGFVVTMGVAEWRARQIGIGRYHVLDMSLTGALICLVAARIFYVVMHWSEFNPLTPEGFNAGMILKMIKLWEGGLVFYGAFLAAFPWIFIYCRKNRIAVTPMMDLIGSGFLGGQFFGRLGCFMTGCCFGKTCSLPWQVTFPKGSPAYLQQLSTAMIRADQARSLPVHPTQLYASIAALLAYSFLLLYWPRRKFDGQILSLTLIMAGATRFFEEALRSDEGPLFEHFLPSLTVAQWVAAGLVVFGFAMLYFFGKRNTLWQGDGGTAAFQAPAGVTA